MTVGQVKVGLPSEYVVKLEQDLSLAFCKIVICVIASQIFIFQGILMVLYCVGGIKSTDHHSKHQLL